MEDYGLVSIITPTWACAAFISETILSIQGQTYGNWELLIQDDCSRMIQRKWLLLLSKRIRVLNTQVTLSIVVQLSLETMH